MKRVQSALLRRELCSHTKGEGPILWVEWSPHSDHLDQTWVLLIHI